MTTETVEIEAALIQIKFQGDNNFIIGNFIDKQNNRINGMGNIINPQLEIDYLLSGHWDEHPKFGEQFKFHSYDTVMPVDTNGIFKYIVRVCKFVGPTIGSLLVDKYGKETLSIMKKDPNRIVREISGITTERAREIQAALLSNEANEKLMVQLESMLDVPGMLKKLPNELFKKYKDKAAEMVEFNPYILTGFRRVSFQLADRVALKNGTPRDDIERKKAATIHCLHKNMKEKGSVWIRRENLIDQIKELIQAPKIKYGLKALEEEGVLVVKETACSLFYPSDDELLIANVVGKMVNGDNHE